MAHGQLSKNNTTMSFAIPKQTKEQLFRIATNENRSASSLVVTLIQQYSLIYNDKELLSQYNSLIYKAKDESK